MRLTSEQLRQLDRPWKIVLISGSRTWQNREAVEKRIRSSMQLFGTDLLILHGDCPNGADAIAKSFCIRVGVPCAAVPAPWGAFGRKAGRIRNGWLARFDPERAYLFLQDETNSPGTKNMAAWLEELDTDIILIKARSVCR